MWTDLLENPKALEMFRPEPSLECVVLTKLLVDRDGPTARMSIQAREYPEEPPARWRMQGDNAVIIELEAMGVDHIKLEGWDTENLVSISINRLPDGKLNLHAFGTTTDIEPRCGWLRVVGVKPYHRGV
jgi:Immunity protein 50